MTKSNIFKRCILSLMIVMLSLGVGVIFSACDGQHHHDFTYTTVQPTCTEDGKKVGVCDCGETETTILPALGHEYQITKSTDGKTHALDCSRCTSHIDEECVLTEQEHAATCMHDGYIEVKCEKCNYTNDIKTDDKTPHAWSTTYELHFKTVEGKPKYFHTRDCVNCNAVDGVQLNENDVPVDANGNEILNDPNDHNHGLTDESEYVPLDSAYCTYTNNKTEVAQPECEINGTTKHYCDVCDNFYVEDNQNATGHSFSGAYYYDEIMGEHYQLCANGCGQKQYTACSYGDTFTYDEAQQKHYKQCENCQHKVYENCSYDEHYTYREKDGKHYHYQTCTANGCNHELEHECEFDMAITREAECKQTGEKSFTCKNCQHNYKETIAELGHSYGAWQHETDGTHIHYCTRNNCEHSETATCLDEKNVIEPSCGHGGFTTHYCSECGNRYESDPTDAIPHNYTDVKWIKVDENQHSRTCIVCGYVDKEEHNMQTTEHQPNCTETGYTENYCTDNCGYSFISDEKPANGHVWQKKDDETHECAVCQETENHNYAKSNICACGLDGLEYGDTAYGYMVTGYGKTLPEGQSNKNSLTLIDGPQSLTIPATNNHKKVVGIAARALRNNKNLTSITIEYGITIIDSAAVGNCPNLKTINVPGSVQDIESDSFYDSYYFEHSELWGDDGLYLGGDLQGEDLKDDGQTARYYLMKVSNINGNFVVKPGTVKIMAAMFYNRTGLTSIELPKSIKVIDMHAFAGCTGLTQVKFNGSVEDWFDIEFVNEYSNPMHYATSLHIDEASGTVTIPVGTTSIPAGTFMNDTEVTTIEIPYTVTEIGANAFKGCTNLIEIKWETEQEVEKSGTIKRIGLNAFENTGIYNSLKLSTTADDGEKATWKTVAEKYWKNGVLYVLNNLVAYDQDTFAGGEYQVEAGTISISMQAFMNCQNLQSVALPESIIEIGEKAFFGCNNLKNLTLTNMKDSDTWLISNAGGAGRHYGKTDLSDSSRNAQWVREERGNGIGKWIKTA